MSVALLRVSHGMHSQLSIQWSLWCIWSISRRKFDCRWIGSHRSLGVRVPFIFFDPRLADTSRLFVTFLCCNLIIHCQVGNGQFQCDTVTSMTFTLGELTNLSLFQAMPCNNASRQQTYTFQPSDHQTRGGHFKSVGPWLLLQALTGLTDR
jgi:hypothetical protein